MKMTIKITDVTGTSIITDHLTEVEAIGIADRVTARESRRGTAQLSEVMIWRERDKASPILANACASALNLGTVMVYMFENDDEGAMTVFAHYEITNCFISRYELDTPDVSGVAYGLHSGNSAVGAPTDAQDAWDLDISVNDYRKYARKRAGVKPLHPTPYGALTEKAIERLWLSGDTVKWCFTNGGIAKGWDIGAGAALSA